MPSLFAALTPDDVRKLLADGLFALAGTNRLYVEGDHWQSGAGWIGPLPQTNEPGFAIASEEIQKGFTSKNVVEEVIRRHVDGCLAREPRWSLTPRRSVTPALPLQDAEKTTMAEAEAALTTWWNDRKIHRQLQLAAASVLWAERAVLRLYIPPAKRTGTTVSAADIPQGLDFVFAEVPRPEDSKVHEDVETGALIGIVDQRLPDGSSRLEEVFLDIDPTAVVDPKTPPNTIIRVVANAGGGDYPVVLGGRLTMYMMRRTALITTQVQQMQRALNLALTVLPRALVTSGWLERVLLNAQMPGKWVRDPDSGVERFEPTEYVTGAATTNFLAGIETEPDDSGRTQLATPDIRWRPPSDVKPITDGKASCYQDILEEVDQAHVMIVGSPYPSGDARDQARVDFLGSLRPTRGEIEAAGAWLLETALAMAETFSGTIGKYTNNFRVVFECNLDVGPASPDMQRQTIEAADKGYLSRETAMERNNVLDVDAEIALIDNQEDARFDFHTRQAVALKAYTDAGVPVDVAAALVIQDQLVVSQITARATNPQPGDPNYVAPVVVAPIGPANPAVPQPLLGA